VDEATVNTRVLAIDPGSEKCGLAVVEQDGAVLAHGVCPAGDLDREIPAWLAAHHPQALVLGKGTGSRKMAARLRTLCTAWAEREGVAPPPLHLVDEAHTTEEARRLYFEDHPPRGLERLLPNGLRLPAQPYDDYAAVLLARRFFAG